MNRADLFKIVKDFVDDYGDIYIEKDTGYSIYVKDDEGSHFKITVDPVISENIPFERYME